MLIAFFVLLGLSGLFYLLARKAPDSNADIIGSIMGLFINIGLCFGCLVSALVVGVIGVLRWVF